ncbi:MAG: HAD-IIB family hydrolase [Nitrospinota bacterium]
MREFADIMRLIIFTDLDGTLLDHSTYSYQKALRSLSIIKKDGIPLIICTSKTAAEIEAFNKKIKNRDPFASENGGALFIPKGYFGFDFKYHKETPKYRIIEIGKQHSLLMDALKEIRESTRISIKGISEMTIKELMEKTGLDRRGALLAKKRDYSEPFILQDRNHSEIKRIKREVIERGLNLTEGGRFYHLMGNNDKGIAVRILTAMYKKELETVTVVGIGDSINDIPMLEEVDIPVLVMRPNRRYDPRIKLNGLLRSGGIGPDGWNRAVLKILKKEVNNG